MESHYYVFHQSKPWARVIAAGNSYHARRICAAVNGTPVTEFYAIRADLINPDERRKAQAFGA